MIRDLLMLEAILTLLFGATWLRPPLVLFKED